MITDDVKEGRYAAARLGEAQANEVTIAPESLVISKKHTPPCSIALKEKARAEAKALKRWLRWLGSIRLHAVGPIRCLAGQSFADKGCMSTFVLGNRRSQFYEFGHKKMGIW